MSRLNGNQQLKKAQLEDFDQTWHMLHSLEDYFKRLRPNTKVEYVDMPETGPGRLFVQIGKDVFEQVSHGKWELYA